MKYIKSIFQCSGLLLLLLVLSSCGESEKAADKELELDSVGKAEPVVKAKPELPRRYQRPAYMIGDEIKMSADLIKLSPSTN